MCRHEFFWKASIKGSGCCCRCAEKHLFLFCFLSLEKLDFAFRSVSFFLFFSFWYIWHGTSQVPECVNPAEWGTSEWEVVGVCGFFFSLNHLQVECESDLHQLFQILQENLACAGGLDPVSPAPPAAAWSHPCAWGWYSWLCLPNSFNANQTKTRKERTHQFCCSSLTSTQTLWLKTKTLLTPLQQRLANGVIINSSHLLTVVRRKMKMMPTSGVKSHPSTRCGAKLWLSSHPNGPLTTRQQPWLSNFAWQKQEKRPLSLVEFNRVDWRWLEPPDGASEWPAACKPALSCGGRQECRASSLPARDATSLCCLGECLQWAVPPMWERFTTYLLSGSSPAPTPDHFRRPVPDRQVMAACKHGWHACLCVLVFAWVWVQVKHFCLCEFTPTPALGWLSAFALCACILCVFMCSRHLSFAFCEVSFFSCFSSKLFFHTVHPLPDIDIFTETERSV